jgi:hypothetical protein
LSGSKQTNASASFAPDLDAGGRYGPLAHIVADELKRNLPGVLDGLVAEIRRRHGDAVAAIVFYGSCLRTRQFEGGVLDLYVIVDSYRAAYASRLLAWLNMLLPPNVFYLEVRNAGTTLRAKYAVVSSDAFARAATPAAIPSIIWARFCQPALLAYARDDDACAAVTRAGVESVLTMVLRAVALLPTRRFRPAELWQLGFKETYAAELRVESPETIRGIYEHAAQRYDRVTREALAELSRRGVLRANGDGKTFNVEMDEGRRRRVRLGWRLRRLVGKPLAAARLVKTMATFGDWLPYALWKLERHTGVKVEPTDWQRRHPYIACWPVILRLLKSRAIR